MAGLLKQLPVVKRTCDRCTHLGTDGDGYEYNGSWPVCNRYPFRSGLKSFPFKTPQRCFEIAYWEQPVFEYSGQDEKTNHAVTAIMRTSDSLGQLSDLGYRALRRFIRRYPEAVRAARETRIAIREINNYSIGGKR